MRSGTLFITIVCASFVLCQLAIRKYTESAAARAQIGTCARAQTGNSCTPPDYRRIRYPRIQPRCIRVVHVDEGAISLILQPQPGDATSDSDIASTPGRYQVALHPFNKLQGNAVAKAEFACTICHYGFNITGLYPDADYLLIVAQLVEVRKEIICRKLLSTTSRNRNLIRNPGFEHAGDSPFAPTRFFRSESSNPRAWTLFYNGGMRMQCGVDADADADAAVYPHSGVCIAQLGSRSILDLGADNNQVQKFYGVHQSVYVSPHVRNGGSFAIGAWYRLSSDLVHAMNESPRDAISMIVSATFSDGTVDDGSIIPFEIVPSALHEWHLNCAVLQLPSNTQITHIHLSFHLHDFSKGSLFIDDVFLRQLQHSDDDADEKCAKIAFASNAKSRTHPKTTQNPIHLKAKVRPKYKQLTIAVPCTPDRVLRLEAMSRLYAGGPVVAAVFVESKEEVRLFTEIWSRRYWLRQYVDVRFVNKSTSTKTPLPINALRNAAVRLAQTEFVVMLDVDMTPATDAFACFRDPDGRYLSAMLPRNERTLLMLPVFVTDQGERSARDKSELLNQLGMRKATSYCINSQKPVKMWKWYTESAPYDVRFSAGFEPYGIARTELYPEFDARFVGYGFNKIAWVLGAENAGYKLLVLPDMFVTHLNHVENDWVQSIDVPQYLNTWRRYFSYVAHIS